MSKIPSVEERVEEFSKVNDYLVDIGGWYITYTDELTVKQKKWLTEALTADRLSLLTQLREMIDRHDPNVKMERETNPAYWGNTLRAELDELINPTK